MERRSLEEMERRCREEMERRCREEMLKGDVERRCWPEIDEKEPKRFLFQEIAKFDKLQLIFVFHIISSLVASRQLSLGEFHACPNTAALWESVNDNSLSVVTITVSL